MTNLLQKKSFDLVVDLDLARAGDAGVTLRTSRAMVRDAMRCDATSTRWATRCDAMCDDEEWDDTTASSMGVDRARATTTAATTAAIARVVIQRGSSRGWCADIGRARARDDGDGCARATTTAMGSFSIDRCRAVIGRGGRRARRRRARRRREGDGRRRRSSIEWRARVDRGAFGGGARVLVVIGRMKWIELCVGRTNQ